MCVCCVYSSLGRGGTGLGGNVCVCVCVSVCVSQCVCVSVCVCVCTVSFRPDMKRWGGGGGGGVACLVEEWEELYMKGGVATPCICQC